MPLSSRDLLRLLARTYARAKRIHLILDNYGIHSATLTQRTLNELRRRRGRIIVHFLPPYCPDANRIEHVWQDLHANVTRNHRCLTLQQLLDKAPRISARLRLATGDCDRSFSAGCVRTVGNHDR